MCAFRIAVIAGSAPGAGEAIDAATTALQRLGLDIETYPQDLGEQRFLRTGELLPAAIVAQLRTMDALFCGSPPASRDPRVPSGTLERGLLFALRRELGLAINVRAFHDVRGGPGGAITVVRENSEGAYFNEGTTLHPDTSAETAIELATTTYEAAYRCAKFATELAASRRGEVVLAHKANVLVTSGRIWERALHVAAQEVPGVKVSVENVDTLCARMVSDPSRYDVVVSDNVFGDVVSDVACAVLDAARYSGSAELAEPGGVSLFEPMHGPQDGPPQPVSVLASLSAAALLASHLGEVAVGNALAQATLACAGDCGSDQGLAGPVLDRVCAAAEKLIHSAEVEL